MRIVTRDGVGLHVEASGPADAPVTVLLSHGWTLDERCWAPVADVLSASGTRAVRYDQRAHGRSDDVPEAEMTIDRLADDMADVIEQTCPSGPLVLAGHSMGGMTVMALAQRHPDLVASRVAGVALVATASGGLGGLATLGMTGRPARAFLAGRRRVTADRRWTGRRRLTGHPALLVPGLRWLLLGTRPDARAVRLTCAAIAGCRPTTLSGFTATLTGHERDDALAAFRDVPTEVLVGTRDRLTPVRLTRRIATGLPHATVTIFPEAGHMLPVERVDGVADRIAALVRQAGATTGPVRPAAAQRDPSRDPSR